MKSPLNETFTFLTDLAWKSRLALPILVTAAFMIMDVRLQIEINIHTGHMEAAGLDDDDDDDDDDDEDEDDVDDDDYIEDVEDIDELYYNYEDIVDGEGESEGDNFYDDVEYDDDDEYIGDDEMDKDDSNSYKNRLC